MWRCPLKEFDPKVPKGPRRGREIPLIGGAGVSLRGLGSPTEGEQKTFLSATFVPPCGIEPQPSEPESEILSIKLRRQWVAKIRIFG